jgi:hypothetical protein
MANFQKPSRGNVSGWDTSNYRVTLAVGGSVDVNLWGGGPAPDHADLDVKASLGGLFEITPLGKVGQNLRGFTLKGKAVGTANLRAVLSKGASTIDYSAPLDVVVTAGAGNGSQANKMIFTSIDKCGIAAVDEILARSIREGREYSGLIVEQGSKFGFTPPIPGEPDSALPQTKPLPGTKAVGTYHTHGNKAGAGEIFSPQDRGFHNLRHWIGYLGTPAGAILKLTPKDRPSNEHPAWAAFGGKATTLRAARQ